MAEPTVQELQQQLTDLNKKLKEAGGLGINLQEAFRLAGNDTKKLNEYTTQLNKQYEDLVDNVDYVYRTFQDISAELKNQNLLLKIGKSSFKGFTDIAQDLNSYQKGYNDLTDIKFKKIKNNLGLEKKELEFVVNRLKASENERKREFERLGTLQQRTPLQEKRLKELQKENELLVNAEEALKSGIPILEKELNLTKQIADTRKDLGGLSQAAGKLISQYGGSLASFLNVNEAIESVEEYNKQIVQGALSSKKVQDELLKKEKAKLLAQKMYNEGKIDETKYNSIVNRLEKESYDVKQKAIASTDTLGNKFQSLGVFVKGLGAGLSKSLLDPVTILTFLIQAINKADQQATALGKSLGISKDQAYGLRENFVAYSRAVNDSFITTDRLAKAQADLSEQLGIAVQYSGEELSIFAKLTEIVGLSAQEAGKLASFSAAAGMSSTDYVKQIRASSFAAQQANKVHFSDKQILQDVSKLSAGILVKFQNNPTALAAAVVQAKALGLTLEQVEKVGESLLNFESSIENELKAELLTGKQINLEKARYLALTGSQAELSKEIASQAGSLAEFENMNVIAQKSLAEAFGMSRDELADMLMKQEAITKYGSKAAELNKEQLEYMEEHNLSADQMLEKVTNQRSVQDKFNDAMLKLQDIIGNLVAGPLGRFVSFLAEGLDYVSAIAVIFGTIYAYQKGMALYQGAMTLMKGKELAVQIGIAAAWAVANPFTALAGLAIAGGIASLVVSQMSAAPKFAMGGIVTEEINNATIGEAGPEAVIPLDSSKAAGMLGGMDISPLVFAINEVRNAVNALANKPQQAMALYVGPEKLGEIVGRQAETGTNQYQNAYQLA